jgi:hypothetical protein
MTQYIVQFGSGKPGEMGTEATEKMVLEKIGIKNPRIGFAPFHHIQHKLPNDWKLFKKIVQPMTKKPITLIEFHNEKDLDSLKRRILKFDIFVLGSGVCEPYFEFMFKNGLDETFREFFRKGKTLLGYSAGSIAVNAFYVHIVFFREILLHWKSVQSSLSQNEIDEFKTMLLHEPSLYHSELSEVLEAPDDLDPFKHPLSKKVFQVTSVAGLGFLPHIALLPHYNQAIHATEEHLESAAKNFPSLHHYGVPNGVALFHSFEKGILSRSEVVGQNLDPTLQVTRFWPKDKKIYKEGDVLETS